MNTSRLLVFGLAAVTLVALPLDVAAFRNPVYPAVAGIVLTVWAAWMCDRHAAAQDPE